MARPPFIPYLASLDLRGRQWPLASSLLTVTLGALVIDAVRLVASSPDAPRANAQTW